MSKAMSREVVWGALSAEQRDVLSAVALGATHRTRTWLLGMLVAMEVRNAAGKRYVADDIKQALTSLLASGWVVEDSVRGPGYFRVPPDRMGDALVPLLDGGDIPRWQAALGRALDYRANEGLRYAYFQDMSAAVAVVRLALLSGKPYAEVEQLRSACRWGMEWEAVVSEALSCGLNSTLFMRLDDTLQHNVLLNTLRKLVQVWGEPPFPLVVCAETYLATRTGPAHFDLRVALATALLWAGRGTELPALLAPLLTHPEADATAQASARAVLAGAQAMRGEWVEAEVAFDAALATLKDTTKKRKNLLPDMVAAPYVLALLAQQSPAHLQKALKFCLAEGGKRTPALGDWTGVVALAVQIRLGEAQRTRDAFELQSHAPYVQRLDAWRVLMAAWLKADDQPQKLSAQKMDALDALRECIACAGLTLWGQQLTTAAQVLIGQAPPEGYFVPPAQAAWRVALAALMSVGEPEPSAASEPGGDTRLIWVLHTDKRGGLSDIVPWEQKRGLRGWGKPKPVTLTKLSKADGLPPADALVARNIKLNAHERSARLDLPAALTALMNHPAVALHDAPESYVTLVESGPEIDVVAVGQQRRVRMLPGLHPRATWPYYFQPNAAELRELEALQSITVLRESTQRARVIRLSPAHKRVAQLLGDGLLIPPDGTEQLQQVLQGLGAHFQVHADEVQAARDVAPDARLRAELSPQGDGVALRLVVAPLGLDGPRISPGSGRARLVAAVQGETLGAQRDLAQERAHLNTVLDACPVLDPLPAGAVSSEWLIDTADDALALLEQLHPLAAAGDVLTALDWPAGKAMRVDTASLGQLHVQVSSASDWLALQGGVSVDESLVFSLGQMLGWAQSGKGRFIPLGEGRYLALTQELRARLDELASVAEMHRGEARVPTVVAGWLETVTDGAQLKTDAAFRKRVATLEAAQHSQPVLPPGLQAQLRPYQEEGYQWAMRLAQAGFGACLADDMGLGKTLQALAVLLARGAGGPALLIAPTSLIGNWQAEARRFAPALQMHVFSESDRESLIAQMGPQDVVLVSYQMQLQHAAAFAAREWHTLVLDEAQAIKNAAAKRSQAVFEVKAGFRMALSGTPIENRLAELWSVMRVCNPGLLGTINRFNERFAAPIERDRDRQAQRTLRRLIGPFILRRTKAQVLDDLPPRTELTLTVQPEAAERAHYEALRRQALETAESSLAEGAAGNAQFNILAQLTRLRRAACDPRLVSPNLGLVGAKVQAFGELATELVANGHKALVFSQFVDFLALLREPLDAAGIKYQYLDGSTPPAERTKRVAAFQAGEGDLFFISLKAGGFGLNLTVADYVVIADPWWNPAAEDQASGRAHRIGQQRPVTVYRLVNQGTLEERIVALHQSKRELADSVLEGGEVSAPLKADELVALIQGD